MNDTQLITIIMPTYNANPVFLHEAIRSCQDQSWNNWELIVVDDGSTNQTATWVTAIAALDKRIHLVRHQQNRKLPAALNTGLIAAQGTYLTWLSDDDLLRPQALERMYGCLENNPDFDLVYSDFTMIDKDGEVLYPIRVESTWNLGIGKTTGICHLVRRKVFELIGGYKEEFFLAEDLDFWIRACMHFNAKVLHEDLACYRQHPTTLTSSYRLPKVLRVHGRILDCYGRKMTWLGRSGLAHAYLRLARKLVQSTDWYLGLWYFGKSLFLDPLVGIKIYHNRHFSSLTDER